MSIRFVILALFTCNLFTACDKPSPPPSPASKYGCRARTPTWYSKKGKEAVGATGDTEDMAKMYAIARYKEKHPDHDPDVNCWDCSTPGLDPAALKICDED